MLFECLILIVENRFHFLFSSRFHLSSDPKPAPKQRSSANPTATDSTAPVRLHVKSSDTDRDLPADVSKSVAVRAGKPKIRLSADAAVPAESDRFATAAI